MIKDKKAYRILVVEDNPGDLNIVEDFLAEQILDPVILRAGNFKQAAAILSSTDNIFDAILLDLTLPDKSGQQLVTEMLQVAALSPVIILTGYTDIDFSIKSISQGIWDYLLKDDLTAVTLYKSILYAIERKKNISSLKESEKRYSDLFHLSPQPMWVLDPDTLVFIQVNKATIALYGYSEEEFLKMTLPDISRKEDGDDDESTLNHSIVNSDYLQPAMMHHKKSGEMIEMEMYSTPIMIDDRAFRSVIAIDVTEKNLYEHRLIKAIINTQESERYEIGGELHDNVCQILATSQLNLGMIESSLPASKIILYNQVCRFIKMAIDEIRDISHRLAPALFDDTTLEEAFGRLFEDFNISGKYDIRVHFNDALRNYPVPQEIKLNLYRILQEQLRNISKYADAKTIEADVVIHNNKLKMRIADDGVGFDMSTVKRGIGLANIKRRTELFYGKCDVFASPGHGCEILINIPLPEMN